MKRKGLTSHDLSANQLLDPKEVVQMQLGLLVLVKSHRLYRDLYNWRRIDWFAAYGKSESVLSQGPWGSYSSPCAAA